MTPMLEKATLAIRVDLDRQGVSVMTADDGRRVIDGDVDLAALARAALLAIREPDGPVIGAGWSSVDADIAEPQISTMAVRDAWSAMIDAILGDEKP